MHWLFRSGILRDPRRPISVDDYAGVLVSLDEAHLYSHSARTGRTEYENVPSDDEDEDDDANDDEEAGLGHHNRHKHKQQQHKDAAEDCEETGMLPMSACEYSIEGLRRAVRKGQQGRPTDYEMRSKLVSKAIQDIGMGRYNWHLFLLCGFGWFADNLWMQGVSLILPSLSAEFGIPEKQVRYTTSALFLGLCFGSFLWGVGSDVLGRRIAFNCTLLITSIFGTLAAYASSWTMVCVLVAALGFGVGGNLPVDGALFLEFLPDASSALLTLLSVWWPVGQLVSSVLAWWQIGGSEDHTSGWRRFVTTIGLLTLAMFVLRFFLFRVFESPKYLLSQGRQAEAVAVIHGLAYRNNTKTWLTEDLLDAVADEGGYHATTDDYDYRQEDDEEEEGGNGQEGMGRASLSSLGSLSSRQKAKSSGPKAASVMKEKLKSFSGARLWPLFQTRQLGMATATIWFVWATIGMGYPLFNAFLPQYLSHGNDSSEAVKMLVREAAEAAEAPSSIVYRNYAITSVMGVPGSLLAAYTVDSSSPLLGRRGTLALSTLVSALFLFLFVVFGRSEDSMLAFSCIEAFAQNIMYGVLYAFTPEIFPAPVRGAGTGVASFLNRVTGLIAPVLAANLPGDGATTPIYLSGALILSAFFGMVLIPIETRGRQRL